MKNLLFIFTLSCSLLYSQDYRVEKDRIIDLFENLKKFGVNENQGNDRVAYSDFEIQARDYISKNLKKLVLKFTLILQVILLQTTIQTIVT